MTRFFLMALAALTLAGLAQAQQLGGTMIPNTPAGSSGGGNSSAFVVPPNSNGGVTLLDGAPLSGDCLTWGAKGVQDAGAPCVVGPVGAMTLSGAGAPASATLADRATDRGVTFNLKTDFGAACDGATDDTAAIQNWLNKARPGVKLVAPAGTCLFSAALTAPTASNYSIAGAGSAATVLKYTGASTASPLINLGVGASTGVAPVDFSVTSAGATTGPLLAIRGIAFTPAGTGNRRIVNVLDFGADPTGAADSTPAFNLAFTAGTNANQTPTGYNPLPCVYAPAGNYKITDAVTLPKNNGCLLGDGRTLTVLNVSSATFNLSAQGVVYAPANNGSTAPIMRDFGIAFTQPDTAARANLVAFPPGIFMQNVGRQTIQNVRISGGSYCIDARGNTGGAFYDNVECGSLVKGLQIGGPIGSSAGALDGVHITGWHFWDFGINALPGLASIYTDGTNVSIEAGRIDWLGVTDSQNFYGNINILADASNSADQWQFTNLSMDGARWLQAGGVVQIANLQNATSGTGPNGAAGGWPTIVSLSGSSHLRVDGYRIGSYQGGGYAVSVAGGELSLANGSLACNNPSTSCANVSNGTLTIRNSMMSPSGAGPWTTAFVGQTGGSLQFYDNYFNTTGNGVGVAFLADDNASSWSRFSGNQMTGWTVVYPTQSESADSAFGPVFVPQTDPTSMQVATDSTGISLWSAANTVGDTLFGHNAGAKINPVGGAGGGYGITAFGNGAAKNATSAIGTTAFGSGACNAVTAGTQATCVGAGAGAGSYGTRGGSGTTAIGYNALNAAWGVNNTALGADAGQALHGGASNLLLGQGVASSTLSTGSNNVFLGTSSNCDAATAGESDTFRLCASTGSTPLLRGNLAASSLSLTVNGALAGGGSVPAASGSCSVAALVGGQIAGSFKASGVCAGGTVTLTFAAAQANGYACDAHNLTTPASAIDETAYSTTGVTFTATMAGDDLIVWKCTGF